MIPTVVLWGSPWCGSPDNSMRFDPVLYLLPVLPSSLTLDVIHIQGWLSDNRRPDSSAWCTMYFTIHLWKVETLSWCFMLWTSLCPLCVTHNWIRFFFFSIYFFPFVWSPFAELCYSSWSLKEGECAPNCIPYCVPYWHVFDTPNTDIPRRTRTMQSGGPSASEWVALQLFRPPKDIRNFWMTHCWGARLQSIFLLQLEVM